MRQRAPQTEQGAQADQAVKVHAAGEQAKGIVERHEAGTPSDTAACESGDRPEAHSLNVQPKCPTGLPSPEIAAAFADMKGWDHKAWEKNLGSAKKLKWLFAARTVEGRQGGNAALWNPVTIATYLASERKTPLSKLDRVFARPAFREWLAAWEDASEYLRAS
jgi:hypothetical protein